MHAYFYMQRKTGIGCLARSFDEKATHGVRWRRATEGSGKLDRRTSAVARPALARRGCTAHWVVPVPRLGAHAKANRKLARTPTHNGQIDVTFFPLHSPGQHLARPCEGNSGRIWALAAAAQPTHK